MSVAIPPHSEAGRPAVLRSTRPQRTPLVGPGQIDHHAADMAVTASADVSLAHVQRVLASAGQWLSADAAPDAPTASLGGLVLHDLTSPLRLGYGTWRDLLLGLQFTDGRGDLITAGGMTVKNVAGYDLTKFLVGSGGSFGLPAAVTLRTYRLPEAAAHASWPVADDLPAKVNALLTGAAPPQWMLVSDETLTAGWLGRDREVSRWVQACDASARTTTPAEQSAVRADLIGGASTRRPFVRLGVPPSRVAGLLRLLKKVGGRATADPVFGVVWVREVDASEAAALGRTCAAVATLYEPSDGPGGWKATPFDVDPAVVALLDRLKTGFDADARLPPVPAATGRR